MEMSHTVVLAHATRSARSFPAQGSRSGHFSGLVTGVPAQGLPAGSVVPQWMLSIPAVKTNSALRMQRFTTTWVSRPKLGHHPRCFPTSNR